MPMITIKYDDAKVGDDQITALAKAIRIIVSEATKIKEVFVYADSPKVRVEVAPIEVFIEMSAGKIKNREELFQEIKHKLSDWKKANSFEYPITLTLTPMDWSFEVGI